MSKVEICLEHWEGLPRPMVRQIVSWCRQETMEHLQEPDVSVNAEPVEQSVVNVSVVIEGPERDSQEALAVLLECVVAGELKGAGLTGEVSIGSVEVSFTEPALEE